MNDGEQGSTAVNESVPGEETVKDPIGRILKRLRAILAAIPRFHGQIVIVVRDGRVDHIKTEHVEKIDELP